MVMGIASNQSSYFGRTLNLNVLIAGKRQGAQSIDKEIRWGTREVDDLDVDLTLIIQHQRALTKRMRTNWGKNNRWQQWVQNGAASGKSVSG